MDRAGVGGGFAQIGFDEVTFGVFEPESGVLMARRAVAAVVEDAVKRGAEYRLAQIATPRGSGLLDSISTSAGEQVISRQFVFSCGSWLGKLFSRILGKRI